MNAKLCSTHAILAALLLWCPASSQAEESPLKQGIQAYNQGNFDQALNHFNDAIQQNPNDAAAHFNRGNCYRTKNDFDHAIADWSEAIRLDPQDPEAHNNRGNAYSIKGEYDKALADANEALRLNPKFPPALSLRGSMLTEKGDYDKAIADFNEALRIAPGYLGALYNLSRSYGLKGDIAMAVANYTRIIYLYPKESEAHNLLGWQLATCADPAIRDGKKAMEHARTACELSNWKYPMALQTLAAAYAETGDFVHAMEYQKKFIEIPGLHPRNVQEAQQRLSLYEAHHPYHQQSRAR